MGGTGTAPDPWCLSGEARTHDQSLHDGAIAMHKQVTYKSSETTPKSSFLHTSMLSIPSKSLSRTPRSNPRVYRSQGLNSLKIGEWDGRRLPHSTLQHPRIKSPPPSQPQGADSRQPTVYRALLSVAYFWGFYRLARTSSTCARTRTRTKLQSDKTKDLTDPRFDGSALSQGRYSLGETASRVATTSEYIQASP